MSLDLPKICSVCKHFKGAKRLPKGNQGGDFGEVLNCKAFPNGIPEIILTGRSNHLSPIEGEKVTFEFTPGLEDLGLPPLKD